MAQAKADRREIIIKIQNSGDSASTSSASKEEKITTAKDVWKKAFQTSTIGRAQSQFTQMGNNASEANVTMGAVGSYAAITIAKEALL